MARPSATEDRPGSADAPESGGGLRRGYARGRERDEQIRASLEPLAPGERPGAVTVAAAVAATLGIVNLALLVTGAEIDGRDPGAETVAAFAVVMLAMAFGMLRGSYWTVLAFQALLSATVIIAALSLMVASNLAAAALCLAITALGGALFWKLVRAMARMQAPSRHDGIDPSAPGA